MNKYEEEYKEALDYIKSIYPTMNGSMKEGFEHFFPELRKSEDERIREELIAFIKLRLAGLPKCDRFIAWLEKQGQTFTKRDIDDAFNKGMAFAKNELEKQKHAWSERDYYMLESIIDDFAAGHKSSIGQDKWLKSLNRRISYGSTKEIISE